MNTPGWARRLRSIGRGARPRILATTASSTDRVRRMKRIITTGLGDGRVRVGVEGEAIGISHSLGRTAECSSGPWPS
jgi:hypothetical protein